MAAEVTHLGMNVNLRQKSSKFFLYIALFVLQNITVNLKESESQRHCMSQICLIHSDYAFLFCCVRRGEIPGSIEPVRRGGIFESSLWVAEQPLWAARQDLILKQTNKDKIN